MLAQLTTSITQALLKAQLHAIEKLGEILDSCTDPKEIRRAAAILLKTRPPEPEAVAHAAEKPAAAAKPSFYEDGYPHPMSPLSDVELRNLMTAFPHLPRETFIHQEYPEYWRNRLMYLKQEAHARARRASADKHDPPPQSGTSPAQPRAA